MNVKMIFNLDKNLFIIYLSVYLFILDKKIQEYNPNKERKKLIVFNDMIADMLSNKKLQLIVKLLFIRGRELHISPAFIKKSSFSVPKSIRLFYYENSKQTRALANRI